jgi:hypothetical protein
LWNRRIARRTWYTCEITDIDWGWLGSRVDRPAEVLRMAADQFGTACNARRRTRLCGPEFPGFVNGTCLELIEYSPPLA